MRKTMTDVHCRALVAFACLLALPATALAAETAPLADIEIVRAGIPHDAFYDIRIDQLGGIAVGAAGTILLTDDGGTTWSQVPPPTPLALLGVALRPGRAIAVGQEGMVLLSDDRRSWRAVATDTQARLLNVDLGEQGLAVAVGAFGTVLRSEDAGETWEPVVIDWTAVNPDGYEPHLYDVIVGTAGRVTIAGEFGLVLLSEDGGRSWQPVHQAQASLFALSLAADGSGWAVGQDGYVISTGDGGRTWREVKVPSESNLLGVWASEHGEVVIVGIRALLRSSDGGRSWRASTAHEVTRGWYLALAAGQRDIKVAERATLVQEVVYAVGNRGIIARVLE